MTTAADSFAEAGLSDLYRYLRRAQPVSNSDEIVARDAFLAGFTKGARYALITSGRLSQPDVQEAIRVLAAIMSDA